MNYDILKVKNNVLHKMMRTKHYLRTLPRGCKYCYGLYSEGILVGGAMFGCPVGANVTKGTLELKRFYIEPGCEKNTASYFLSRCLKDLKGKANKVITYADPKAGHTGAMYKASNFIYVGKQPQGTPYYQVGNKRIWQNNVHCQDDVAIVKILSGQAPLKRMLAKHIFIYNLERK